VSWGYVTGHTVTFPYKSSWFSSVCITSDKYHKPKVLKQKMQTEVCSFCGGILTVCCQVLYVEIRPCWLKQWSHSDNVHTVIKYVFVEGRKLMMDAGRDLWLHFCYVVEPSWTVMDLKLTSGWVICNLITVQTIIKYVFVKGRKLMLDAGRDLWLHFCYVDLVVEPSWTVMDLKLTSGWVICNLITVQL
jgi:hypothetical protein